MSRIKQVSDQTGFLKYAMVIVCLFVCLFVLMFSYSFIEKVNTSHR